MDKTPVEEVTIYKYLGVKIDNELNFKGHINGVISNVAYKIKLLYNLRNKLTLKAALDVYRTMIVPLLDVGVLFYRYSSKKVVNKLQVLQNRALRVIYKLPARTNTDQYHNRANIVTLQTVGHYVDVLS